MNKLLALLTLVSVTFTAAAKEPYSDSVLLKKINENIYRAAGGGNPYEEPSGVEYTKDPKGYKPFYVSHMGRHGSRYQITDKHNAFTKPTQFLDSLSKLGVLSPEGDSLRMELKIMKEPHHGNSGMLTIKGGLEHQGIARRLYQREKGLFSQKDRRKVSCTSTDVPRAIMSMANFGTVLEKSNPALMISYKTGLNKIPGVSPVCEKDLEINIRDSAEIYKKELISTLDLNEFKSKIFGSKAQVSNQKAYSIFSAASGAACLDEAINPLRFFSHSELLQLMRISNLRSSGIYGGHNEYSREQIKLERNRRMLRDIIKKADSAIEGNGYCADFIFAHDTNIGPLNRIIGIYEDTPGVCLADLWRYWPSWENICMGTNIQIVFYKNSTNDVLVKILRNEREMTLPELEPDYKTFYSWKKVRRYWLNRLGEYQELPEEQLPYLEAKVDEIKNLQRDESDGFYFITDCHFPSNAGHPAAMLEYLTGATCGRKVIFGGDTEATVDNVSEGIYPMVAFVQQARSNAPVYCARGNHDFTTNTRSYKQSLSQRETAKLFRVFDSEGLVFNQDDPYSTYGYLDNPQSKLRYIFFDTTDSVKDRKVVYGVSPSQMKWMIGEALLGCPKGWNIVVISHVPLSKNHNKVESIANAGNCLAALYKHTTFEFEGKTYDFSTRKDLQPVLIISGHRHRDAVDNIEGLPQILVDANINKNTIKYVSLGKDRKTIRVVDISAE